MNVCEAIQKNDSFFFKRFTNNQTINSQTVLSKDILMVADKEIQILKIIFFRGYGAGILAKCAHKAAADVIMGRNIQMGGLVYA